MCACLSLTKTIIVRHTCLLNISNIQNALPEKPLNMTESIVPPEGQLSFSGIPSAEFVEDVDAHMAGEESAESQLKVETYIMLDMTIVEKTSLMLIIN